MNMQKRPAGSSPDHTIETLSRDPISPNSKKVYVEGKMHPDLRVPFREIKLASTIIQNSAGTEPIEEKNEPVLVYDTSGPYTDPDAKIDIRKGLEPVRAAWIEERGDSEQLDGLTSEYGRRRARDLATEGLRFPHIRAPRRAKAGHWTYDLNRHIALRQALIAEVEQR